MDTMISVRYLILLTLCVVNCVMNDEFLICGSSNNTVSSHERRMNANNELKKLWEESDRSSHALRRNMPHSEGYE